MTLHSPVKPRNILIIALILIVATIFVWNICLFYQITGQSERHDYTYSIDLSYSTTIDNVTLFLPVPELNNTPFFIDSILNGTAYGVSPDWDITIVRENGTPMLAIRAARMIPEYHGYPIPIEPGVSVLPTTLRPGHEYSSDTPVLMPVSIAVMEKSTLEIETRSPIGHEPVFFPDGGFTPGLGIPPTYNGPAYDHQVPVYISYSSDRPVSIMLRVRVQGANSIWKGGWQSNTYSDTVVVEIANDTQGWLPGEGRLLTAGGVYY
jgi:hypothetical protein